jgi:hypothetical protein
MSQTPSPLPLPVQPLPYSPPSQDAWASVVRVVAATATVFAGLQLFCFASQFGMAFSGSQNFSAMQFRFTDFRSSVSMVAQLALAAGAVVMLAGSLGRQVMRPGARTLMLVGLWIVACAELLAWVVRILMTLSGTIPRSFGALGTIMYIGYTFGFVLMRILLPALLIWVLTRGVIRQQYDGTVSFR